MVLIIWVPWNVGVFRSTKKLLGSQVVSLYYSAENTTKGIKFHITKSAASRFVCLIFIAIWLPHMIGNPAWKSWVQNCWEQSYSVCTRCSETDCYLFHLDKVKCCIELSLYCACQTHTHTHTHTCVMLIWWGVIPLLCKNSSDVTHFVTQTYAHVVSIHYQFARVSVR